MCDQILQKRLYFCLNELINDKDVLDFVNDYQIIEHNYYLTDLYSDNGIKEGMISFEFNERTLINESIFYKGTLKIYINDIELAVQIEIPTKNTEIGHLASPIIATSKYSNNDKIYTIHIKPFVYDKNHNYNLAPGIASCVTIFL